MTSWRPEEWFWAMFEPTPTLPNFDFGKFFMWIGANNDQIRLPRGLRTDFDKCLNRLPTWPDFTFGPLVRWIGANNGQIWLSRGYKSDFEQCSNRLQLGLISILVNFSYELRQIMTRYDLLEVRWVIFSNVLIYSNFLYEFCKMILADRFE